MNKRNVGMHTSAEQAKLNILSYLVRHDSSASNTYPKSLLGYAAYPDYSFKAPQGAAFSVAKIVREMESDGLVASYRRGRFVTAKGRDYLKGGAA